MGGFRIQHLSAGAVGMALVFAGAGCEFAGPGLTRANFERIKEDGSMTRQDVDKLLGGPGTDYRGDPAQQLAGAFERTANKLGGLFKGGPEVGKAAVRPAGGTTTYVRWGDENRNVVCAFRGGKVVKKQQRGIH